MKIVYDSFEWYSTIQGERFMGSVPCYMFVDIKPHLKKDNVRANWHDNLEIQLCTGGEGFVIINGEKFDMKKGDIFIINSDSVHYNGTDGEVKYTACVFDVNFFKEAAIDPTKIIFKTAIRDDVIEELILQMSGIYRLGAGNILKKAKMQEKILQVLIRLVENYVEEQTVSLESKALSQVKRTILFLRENYQKKLTLDMIAKNALIDKYNLSRAFKEDVGQTIFEYLNSYRCERAKDLIRSGMQIGEVAWQCGFNSASFFIKTFKKHTGQLPSFYKR